MACGGSVRANSTNSPLMTGTTRAAVLMAVAFAATASA
jgi:hypothetical protein